MTGCPGAIGDEICLEGVFFRYTHLWTQMRTKVIAMFRCLSDPRALMACLMLLPIVGQSNSSAEESIAIINAHVYTMTESGSIDNATVLIKGGRIAAVGRDVAVPKDTLVFDALGRPVTPGLMASVTQLGLVEVLNAQDTVDTSAEKEGLGAGFDIQHALNSNSTLIPLARADGVTRAVVFPSASAERPFSGLAATVCLVESGSILDRSRVALFATIGASIERNVSVQTGQSRSADWIRLRSAIEKSIERNGMEDPKALVDSMHTMQQRLDAAALRTVIEQQAPLAILVRRESDIRQALKLVDDFGIKVVILGGAEAWRVAEELARKNVPVILDPYDNLPMTFDEIGARSDNAAILVRAGVSVAFYVSDVGMSHGVGAGLRERAGSAWGGGLSWEESMAAITSTPAKIWGLSGDYGTLEVGKEADLVVWDNDPLEPMSAPVFVFVRGASASLRTRQTELSDRYHPQRLRKKPPGQLH